MPRGWFTKCLYAYISGETEEEREIARKSTEKIEITMSKSRERKTSPNLNVLHCSLKGAFS